MAGGEPPTPRRRRRTQAERRTATRGALLDATIDTLIEHGYAGTTTTRVVERAGVSRGAQVHHFPTKAALVSEAIRHLAARRTEEALREVTAVPGGTEQLQTALDLVWASHSGPLFEAALELWVAGRTDPELREELVAVENELLDTVWATAGELYGEHAAHPDFQEHLLFALATMRGLAVLELISVNGTATKLDWEAARERLVRLFENGQPSR